MTTCEEFPTSKKSIAITLCSLASCSWNWKRCIKCAQLAMKQCHYKHPYVHRTYTIFDDFSKSFFISRRKKKEWKSWHRCLLRRSSNKKIRCDEKEENTKKHRTSPSNLCGKRNRDRFIVRPKISSEKKKVPYTNELTKATWIHLNVSFLLYPVIRSYFIGFMSSSLALSLSLSMQSTYSIWFARFVPHYARIFRLMCTIECTRKKLNVKCSSSIAK